MSTEVVLYEEESGVAVITLNRPERRNALNTPLTDALMAAFERARDAETVRAVVLTGAGKGFCAGADLADSFSATFTPEQGAAYIKEKYGPLMGLIASIPKPVIGAINGAAAGAGAALALACDLRVMAEDAYVLYAFVNIGLGPDAGAGWFLARQVGYSRAFELATSGAKISAQKCQELGLTNRIAPASDLLSNATAWAQQYAKGPTVAYGITKDDLNFAIDNPLQDTIEREADNQMSGSTIRLGCGRR